MTREEIKNSFGDLDKRMRFLQSERDRYRTLRCSAQSANRRKLVDNEILRIDSEVEKVWDLIKARDRALEKAKEEAK
jgi:hypothetical protein